MKHYTIKYAKAKANRARIWLEANERNITWSKGDDVRIYSPYTFIRGSINNPSV